MMPSSKFDRSLAAVNETRLAAASTLVAASGASTLDTPGSIEGHKWLPLMLGSIFDRSVAAVDKIRLTHVSEFVVESGGSKLDEPGGGERLHMIGLVALCSIDTADEEFNMIA